MKNVKGTAFVLISVLLALSLGMAMAENNETTNVTMNQTANVTMNQTANMTMNQTANVTMNQTTNITATNDSFKNVKCALPSDR